MLFAIASSQANRHSKLRGWSVPLRMPVPCPSGHQLQTLLGCGLHIHWDAGTMPLDISMPIGMPTVYPPGQQLQWPLGCQLHAHKDARSSRSSQPHATVYPHRAPARPPAVSPIGFPKLAGTRNPYLQCFATSC